MFSRELVGCRVIINTIGESFQGLVKRVSNDGDIITLTDGIAVSDKQRIPCILKFSFEETLSCEICQQSQIKSEEDTHDSKNEEKLIPTHQSPNTKSHLALVVDSDEGEVEDNDVEETANNYLLTGQIVWTSLSHGSNIAPHINFPLPSNYLLISNIDETFHKAISEIKSQILVGVYIEGINLSRYGKISVIAISFSEMVYLFDIIKLEKGAFHHGLKEIFESLKITKVFHDCKLASDALSHLFSVELANVMDTQVEDIVLYSRSSQGKKLPLTVRSLEHCLNYYLRLTKLYTTLPVISLNQTNKDAHPWLERPLTKNKGDFLVLKVVYLLALHNSINSRLQNDIIRGNKIYLTYIRDASDNEFALKQNQLAPPGEMSHRYSQDVIFIQKLNKMEDEHSIFAEVNDFETEETSQKNCKINPRIRGSVRRSPFQTMHIPKQHHLANVSSQSIVNHSFIRQPVKNLPESQCGAFGNSGSSSESSISSSSTKIFRNSPRDLKLSTTKYIPAGMLY